MEVQQEGCRKEFILLDERTRAVRMNIIVPGSSGVAADRPMVFCGLEGRTPAGTFARDRRLGAPLAIRLPVAAVFFLLCLLMTDVIVEKM